MQFKDVVPKWTEGSLRPLGDHRRDRLGLAQASDIRTVSADRLTSKSKETPFGVQANRALTRERTLH